MDKKSIRIWVLITMQAFLLCTESLYAQTDANCEVLSFILRNNAIRDAFFLNKTDEDVIIADMTPHIWDHCKIELDNGPIVFFEKDTLPVGRREVLHISLYEFKKYGLKYNAQLHQKETNAYAKIEVKKRRRFMKIVKVEISRF